MFRYTLLIFISISILASSGLRHRKSTSRRQSNTRPWRLTALANKMFAHRLFRTTARHMNSTTNFFISPFAVSAGLAMTLYGARGETARQIMKTLGYADLHRIGSFDQSRVPLLYHKLLEQLFRRNHGFTLTSANRMFGDQSETFNPSFLDGTQRYYGARLMEVDFIHEADDAVTTINNWVANVTNNTIREAISSNAVTSDTKLVLVSTLYFQGEWETPFERSRTSTFFTPDGEIDMEYMSGFFYIRYAEARAFESLVLELPYRTANSSRYQMVMELIVPQRNDADLRNKIERQLTSDNYQYDTQDKSFRSIILEMPKFRIQFGTDLRDILLDMGLEDLFTHGAADLSGINNRHNLALQSAEHKTFLEVTKSGTSAGASVALEIMKKQTPEMVTVDHPFYIILREKHTRMPLFMGRIVNPSAV